MTTVAACARSEAGAPTFVADTATPAVVMIAAEDDAWDRPYEVISAGDGWLYLPDGTGRIVAVTESGDSVRRLGAPGQGPGELSRPRALRAFGDSLLMLDGGNGRIQIFDLNGTSRGSRPMPPLAAAGAVDFGRDGSLLVSSNGQDGVLARWFSADGKTTRPVGEAVSPVAETIDMMAIRREIAEGAIPPLLRNMVHPIQATDGGCWVVLDAEARIRRYNTRDSLVWDIPLEDPTLAAIRAAFILANESLPPYSFSSLTYVADAKEIGGNLVVLLEVPNEDDAVLLVIGRDGVARGRLFVPGATGITAFAVGSDGRSLFLLDRDDAALLRTELPPAIRALL